MIDCRIGPLTPRYAVLGESLPHTWSPFIHNSLFQAAGLDAVYLPITVPKHQLSSAVDVLRSCFCGFNVTIPYKEQIIPLLDQIDEAATICGTVNTVENREGKLIGHITDGLGMLRAIEEANICVNQVDALVLGGGGAARVAAYEFLSRKGKATIAVRNLEKGKLLANELADTQPDGMSRIDVCQLSDIPGYHDILVNCTPVGMYPRADDCPVTEETVCRCAAVFDAVYNPRMTQLLAYAANHRIPYAEGLGMLFYQAVEAQRFWYPDHTIASSDDQRKIYLELLKRF